ncbi:MAG: hypothetical protein JRH20_25355 [Deltaproteobacteria bacterium]|nr:hypothetical protein [Deltaproteobacteria bacterium]
MKTQLIIISLLLAPFTLACGGDESSNRILANGDTLEEAKQFPWCGGSYDCDGSILSLEEHDGACRMGDSTLNPNGEVIAPDYDFTMTWDFTASGDLELCLGGNDLIADSCFSCPSVF